MKKTPAIVLIIAAVYWSFAVLLPSNTSQFNSDTNTFSTERALEHLKIISENVHYVGTSNHTKVRDYIVRTLEDLGLSVEIQEGYTISKWGNLVKAKNIVSRIKGTENSKALLLLTHYDSAPHSSFGASDAGSGVVTILEGLRAFLEQGKPPKNDIIILISDAEELGLNGADLFVNHHKWANDVGLVLNFEARGSGGPSYMLIETNGGNSKLIDAFKAANPKFPVANSLAYSIYKMLPNDTDLTRFRVDANIDGFNFAFIDDHFDYHTSNDTFKNLDIESLEHQASYLMPLLDYFSQSNLNDLKSKEDQIYFNVPLFNLVSYSYSWIWPMLILAILIFGVLIIIGLKKHRLQPEDMLKGWLPLLGSLALSGALGYALWELILRIYPGYSEILQGFTYNGHTYILAFVFLSLGVCSYFYSKFYKPGNTVSLLVAPIALWLIIGIIAALKLKGASFFIIPVYFALLSLFILIKQRKPNLILMAVINFPLLIIMSPFVKMFPVGLGLKILFVSCILVVLIFSLLNSVFGFFRHKRRWSVIMYIMAIICFLVAHFSSSFNEEHQKPNSLLYVLDADLQKANWVTYDKVLDSWTSNYLGKYPETTTNLNILPSKYNTKVTYMKAAQIKPLVHPVVEIYKDTTVGDYRELSIEIKSNRYVNRLDFFANDNSVFKDFIINGVQAHKTNDDGFAFASRKHNSLFSYFVADQEPLKIKFTVPKNQVTKIDFYETSNDLLSHRLFTVPKRNNKMMPKPFVLNDAVIIKKSIVIE